MPIIFTRRYTRNEIGSNPTRLYVFGDNFQRSGHGGQARECRGLPNTIGIPTKRAPSTHDSAYLTDADLHEWLRISTPDFARIVAALGQGKTLIFPADGIGTGLAQLPTRAPRIWHELQAKLHALQPDLFAAPAPPTSPTPGGPPGLPSRPKSAPSSLPQNPAALRNPSRFRLVWNLCAGFIVKAPSPRSRKRKQRLAPALPLAPDDHAMVRLG